MLALNRFNGSVVRAWTSQARIQVLSKGSPGSDGTRVPIEAAGRRLGPEMADRLVIIGDGRIAAQGTRAELLAGAETLVGADPVERNGVDVVEEVQRVDAVGLHQPR